MNKKIKNVACIGAGLIGQGWATLFAAAGYAVTMQDLSDQKLNAATAQVRSNLKLLEDNGQIGHDTAAGAYKYLHTTLSLAEAVNRADYIQESIPDDYAAKKTVFKKMDALAAGDSILASSSSGLLMSEVQTGLARPDRCVLVHPCLPVHLIPLVEVVGGDQTTPETVEIACHLMKKNR